MYLKKKKKTLSPLTISFHIIPLLSPILSPFIHIATLNHLIFSSLASSYTEPISNNLPDTTHHLNLSSPLTPHLSTPLTSHLPYSTHIPFLYSTFSSGYIHPLYQINPLLLIPSPPNLPQFPLIPTHHSTHSFLSSPIPPNLRPPST